MTAFVELAFSSILSVCFQVTVFGCNSLGEFLSMILVNFFIGMPVQIILALIKKGAKIMYDRFNRGQEPKVNKKMRDQAKVGIAWVN